MPVAAFVIFVKGDAKAGSLVENPFCLRGMNLQELRLSLGAKKIPAMEYKLNLPQLQSQLALWETYMSLDYFGSNTGPGNYNRNTLDNGAFIFGFDLSRDGAPNAGYLNSNFEASNLSLEGSFRDPTTFATTGNGNTIFLIRKNNFKIFIVILVMCFGLYNGQIEINKFYAPYTSW